VRVGWREGAISDLFAVVSEACVQDEVFSGAMSLSAAGLLGSADMATLPEAGWLWQGRAHSTILLLGRKKRKRTEEVLMKKRRKEHNCMQDEVLSGPL
jgi:hypothetical protein